MKQIKIIFLAFISIMLISCVGNNSSTGSANNSSAQVQVAKINSSPSTDAAPDVPTGIGVLPNGSQIIMAQSSFVEQPTASFTTPIFLTDANSESDNTAYKLSFSIMPSVTKTQPLTAFKDKPLPTLVAQDCNITAAGYCMVAVDTNNAPLGTYYVTPVFTNSQTGEVSYANPVSYTVTNVSQASSNKKGKLSIMVTSTDIAQIGDSIYGFVGLTDSEGVESLTVQITPTYDDESNIASVKPETCVITSKTVCMINITGLEEGSTSFTATALNSSDYKPARTPIIQVHAPIVPGYISLDINPDSISYQNHANVKITLNDAINVNNLNVRFVSLNPTVATISPGCIIINSKPGTNSCTVDLTAGTETGMANVIAYVNENNYVPDAKIVRVHEYPTKGNLQITLKNPEIAYGQKTTATITLVNSSYVESFEVSESSSNPSIATIDTNTPCVLSSSHNSCEVGITAGNESGIVNIISSAYAYEPVQTSLNVYPTPIPGSLSISLSPATFVTDGGSTATVTLNNSQYVKDALITVASDATNIATINGDNTCHLSSVESNTCHIHVKGVAVGSANITAAANGYTTAKTPISVITPGTLSISPNSINVVYGAQSTITLSLNGSVGVNNANVQLTSSDTGIAIVTGCSPSTVASNSTTCTAIVTAGQSTGPTTITANVNVGGYTYSPVVTTVSVTPNILPGTLAITPTNITLPKSSSTDAIISLVNSRFVTNPIKVSISSQNADIAGVKTNTCSLTTESPTCSVRVDGINMGSTSIQATSAGYNAPQAPVSVTKPNDIPSQCSNAQNGGFNAAAPFNGVKVTYKFTPNHFSPAPYGIVLIDSGWPRFNIADSANVNPGIQIITDSSRTNPVTVGKVERLSTEDGSSGSVPKVIACKGNGDAWASSDFSVRSVDAASIDRGMIHLYMWNHSNSACGTNHGNTIDMEIPMSGFSQTQTLYENDQQGCGNSHWDDGARVQINGSGCIGDNCAYNVIVTSWHGGVGGQCHDTQSQVYQLNVRRPKTYLRLSNLSNFVQQGNPSFVGRAGQSVTAAIGGSGLSVSPILTCPASTNSCTSTNPFNVWYSNGTTSTIMSYGAGLVGGDTFNNVCVDFRPN